MAIDADIRDQAYQFFIQEAPDLLQIIETGLLTLSQERSTPKIHELMRAAHSLKGGAASVGLETIKILAHRLEDGFKALHHEELTIDTALETLYLQAFDCLRSLVWEEIQVGQQQDPAQILELAEPVLAALEARLEGFLGEDAHLPSSIELGVDIARSIFEVDIAEGMARIATVLSQTSEPMKIAAELRAQAEVFIGIAELLSLPGFAAIAQMTLDALNNKPKQALEIAHLALADFQTAQQAVLAGDRTQGGAPSIALAHMTTLTSSFPEAIATDFIEPAIEIIETEDLTGLTSIWGDVSEDGFEAATFEADTLETDTFEADTKGITAAADLDLGELWGAPEAAEANLSELWGAPEVELNGAGSVTSESEPTEVFGSDEGAVSQPSLSDFWVDGESFASEPVALDASASLVASIEADIEPEETMAAIAQPQALQDWVQSIEATFNQLPPVEPEKPLSNPQDTISAVDSSSAIGQSSPSEPPVKASQAEASAIDNASLMTVKVGLERLERMNNLVGELVINRNSLSLQNEQLLRTVQELLQRFSKFQSMANQLRTLSDRLVVAPERRASLDSKRPSHLSQPLIALSKWQDEFDSLEMDSYGELHLLLQSTVEEIAQLEENTGDIALLSKQSTQTLQTQRQMLGHLQDDLMWARMLPIGQVLNRFPRTLRDLSLQYHKPVELKLNGTGVLVDKAILEKLYNPLLHLLRNAFDHGIETPEIRLQHGKQDPGKIEIRAYHRGSQTIIEVQDNGQGINLERIRQRATEMDWVSAEQAAMLSSSQLLDFIFQPGFSTAQTVSDLSGRGVGLDVVRSQLQALKGTISINSEAGRGTTFTLRIPLTLTITKLLVCLVGSAAFALPSDSIEEILVPNSAQIKQATNQRFLHWRDRLVPIAPLSELFNYACPSSETLLSQTLETAPTPEEWALPLLILRQGDQVLALEVDRLATEQELVIKPFGSAIAPPSYIYGCTILGDGSLIPVLNGTALFDQITRQETVLSPKVTLTTEDMAQLPRPKLPTPSISSQSATLLIVDDSIALRQTLALTLQKAGYRVLQARDGREALDQLQKNINIQMVICDVEMPNMNGFEFLSHRRQDPSLFAIPVAMLTSRGNDKHRKLAAHLGATAYFTKPYIEQDFLKEIGQIIGKQQPVSVS
jgi:chemotaxis family two-component system sensor histidine kinase/response regulator PixL